MDRVYCSRSALLVPNDDQYDAARQNNATHDRRQRQRVRPLGGHLDGAEIDDLLPGRIGEALLRKRGEADHNQDNARHV